MNMLLLFFSFIIRLYPVAGVVTRVLNDDIELCGYLIPKDVS